MSRGSVSAVIATHNRVEACLAAIESVLAQDVPPDELIVCDDGSTDGTRERLESDPRVRYLRLERPSGGPATPRNLGVAEARGEWIAFLDDDDRWLPGKLAAQHEALAAGAVDVVSSDAERVSGGRYFASPPPRHPARADLLADNPVITSSALVRRSAIVAAGGFPTARWLAGIEDYALWLALSDRGARFAVLDAALVAYDDRGDVRLSERSVRVQRALARLMATRWARRPWRAELLRAAGNQAVRSLRAVRAAPRVEPRDDGLGPG